MKTLVYITLCCVASLPATAQMKVGANPTTINTGAILQVDANGSRGAFQLPRVTLTGTGDVTTVASPQAGFTVYNTAIAGTAPNNVTPGYYYYDGAQWQKILASGNGSTTNIYTADGTLAGNRTVSQGANTLAFTSSAVNGFSVAGNTFSVDAANSRIGIGTTAPVASLDVSNGGSSTIPALKLATPFSGAVTDSLLTWNSADKSVRKVSWASVNLTPAQITGAVNNVAVSSYTINNNDIGTTIVCSGTTTINLAALAVGSKLSVIQGSAGTNLVTIAAGGGITPQNSLNLLHTRTQNSLITIWVISATTAIVTGDVN